LTDARPGRLLKNETSAAGAHWAAPCVVLSRARSAATSAPCVLALRVPEYAPAAKRHSSTACWATASGVGIPSGVWDDSWYNPRNACRRTREASRRAVRAPGRNGRASRTRSSTEGV